MALIDTFSCPRRPRLTPTRALWARVGATGHAVVLSPLGVRIALVARTCLGRGGVNYVTDAPRGSRSCRTRTGLTRRGIPLGVGDSHGPHTSGPPTLGSHLALIPYVPGGWWV